MGIASLCASRSASAAAWRPGNAARQDIGQLRERLSLIDAAARLGQLLDKRAAPSAYKEYRGLLGQVHEDLVQLSADLGQARTEWLASGSISPPPLERIVLYIDDLDRCPPRLVVEVLEAVHLMLALELFVVIVAVDARWLIRSLEYHHHELFSTPGHSTADLSADDAAGQATPIDYLDKIFQIPYALLTPQPTATGAYLRALLPEPTLATGSAPTANTAEASGRPTSGEAPDTRAGEPEDTPPDPYHDDAEQRRSARQPSPSEPRMPLAERQGATASPDLRPQGLQLSPVEVEFMTRLGTLVPTPRAAKKLANLYRLVRISIPETELASFIGNETGGPYQAVQVLLAILIGSPTMAYGIFQRLLAAPAEDDLMAVLSAADLDQAGKNPFESIGLELEKISLETQVPIRVTEYQRWCPTLARYSFRTRALAGPPPEPGRIAE